MNSRKTYTCPFPLDQEVGSTNISSTLQCLQMSVTVPLSLSGAAMSLPAAKCAQSSQKQPPRFFSSSKKNPAGNGLSPFHKCIVGFAVPSFQLTKLAQFVQTIPLAILKVHTLCTPLFAQFYNNSNLLPKVYLCKISAAAQTQNSFPARAADLATCSKFCIKTWDTQSPLSNSPS